MSEGFFLWKKENEYDMLTTRMEGYLWFLHHFKSEKQN